MSQRARIKRFHAFLKFATHSRSRPSQKSGKQAEESKLRAQVDFGDGSDNCREHASVHDRLAGPARGAPASVSPSAQIDFRAVEPHPHTRSLHPGLGGADYYSRKQLKHARNAVLSAELLVFAFVLALVLRALGW